MARFVKIGEYYLNLELVTCIVVHEYPGSSSIAYVSLCGKSDPIQFAGKQATNLMKIMDQEAQNAAKAR